MYIKRSECKSRSLARWAHAFLIGWFVLVGVTVLYLYISGKMLLDFCWLHPAGRCEESFMCYYSEKYIHFLEAWKNEGNVSGGTGER